MDEKKSSSKAGSEQHMTDFGFTRVAEEEKQERVKEVFDQVAEKYDLLNDICSLGMHRLWKKQAVDTLGLAGSMRVLDIAAGTGDMSIRMGEKLSKDSEIWLTDINSEMLRIGKERADKACLNAHIQVCDAEHLPFEDNYFDRIIVSFGLRNMTHKDQALKEMRRVLAPGGRAIVLEFSRPAAFVAPFYNFYTFKVMPFIAGKVAGNADSYRYLAESIRLHPDQMTLAKIMKDAGFDRVEWKDFTFGITALHIGYKD